MKPTLKRSACTIALICLLGGIALFGQGKPSAEENRDINIDAYIDLLREDIRTQKTAVLSQMMQLTADEAKVFWPIYSDYEKELKALGDERVAGIKEYAEYFPKMTDEKAHELIKRRLAYEEKLLGLKKKYYERIKEALSATLAARFVQVENQLLALVDLQVMASLPVVEEGPKNAR